MKRVLSVSVTALMLEIMMLTGADVQNKEIQETYEISTQAPAMTLEISTPETGVLYARTHNVHLYTQEDAELIKRIALAEGETEGADGMWMIMSCIVNRLHDPDYPDTVQGVVYQKNVFSCLKDGNFAKAAVNSDDAEAAWARIEAGDVCPQIIAFEGIGSDVLDTWFWYAFTYKKHKFYTKKE